MDIAIIDRLQFAFTIMFHYLFPITTMGLAPFVAYYTIRASRNHNLDDARAATFWTRIFTINFAIGVVTGIPMEFQFGTNWAVFSARAGSVIGQPLAMEGIYAFFLESIFLGALFYARRDIPTRLQAVSSVFVWLGSWLSGFFIIVTNAWMQHPVGYTQMPDGTIQMQSLPAVVFSPFAWWQFAHVVSGAIVTGSFVVGGVGAYYLLSRREPSIGRNFVRIGSIVALIFTCFSAFPSGDANAANVTSYQPIKLAAMEGLFQTQNGAPIALLGMPDLPNHRLIDPVVVPDVLSFLAYGNFRANVKGLNDYSIRDWPPVDLTYYAYHIMVGLGTIFCGIAALEVLFLLLKRLYDFRPMLWLMMLAMPFPYVANEAGWVTTEVGRQPWIVYGILRTADASSPTVAGGETVFTLIGFIGMYFLLGVLWLFLVLREIGIGPSGGHGTHRETIEVVS
jgi:cytochrome bd ubiquinol oxidase subunit I